MKLEVLTTRWAADEQVFDGGVHDVKLTRKLAPLVAGAEAAGVVVVKSATREERKQLVRHVESQAAGEKAYDRAQEGGRWQHGNLVQHIATLDDRLAAGVDDEGERAGLEVELANAKQRLAETEVPE